MCQGPTARFTGEYTGKNSSRLLIKLAEVVVLSRLFQSERISALLLIFLIVSVSSALYYWNKSQKLSVALQELSEEYKSLSERYEDLEREINLSFTVRFKSQFMIAYNRSLMPDEYAIALLNLTEEIRRAYYEIFGFTFSPRCGDQIILEVYESMDPWCSGADKIFLPIPSREVLTGYRIPENKTPHAHWIGGLAHECAHLLLYFTGPDWYTRFCFNEGWALYAQLKAVQHLVERGKDKVWPLDYDVAEYDVNVLLRAIENKTEFRTPREERSWNATRIFYKIDQKYGTKAIPAALRSLVPRLRNCRVEYDLEEFKQALVEVTGDPEIITLFEEHGYG